MMKWDHSQSVPADEKQGALLEPVKSLKEDQT